MTEFESRVELRLQHIESNIDSVEESIQDMRDEYESILERLTDNWGDTKTCKECHGTGDIPTI
jgi:septation ring formation regulator EzrA